MGVRRACHRALARLAVIARLTAVLLILSSVAGCAAVSDITGAVAGLASGAATGNPAVGIGVGIAVRAGTYGLLDRVARTRQRKEHDAIAAAVGETGVGETRPWAVDQRVVGDAHWEVRVMRVIETPLARCKEVAFSVVEGERATPAWFTTTACEHGGEWRWAVAEPAVERWVNLQ